MYLSNLHIKNFAIIDEVSLSFGAGLTIITGETGAGKSIIIDALGMAIGEKTSSSMVRSGADKSVVECIFKISDRDLSLVECLSSKGIDIKDDSVRFKREIYLNGRSRAWINDISISIGVAKEVSNLLLDFHGQHDHQSLLNEDTHIFSLDAFGNYSGLVRQVSSLWNELKKLMEEREILLQKKQLNREKRELWEFQLKEIQKVNPVGEEYDSLLKEKSLLENSEKIHQTTSELTQILYESEDSFFQRIQDVSKKLSSLVKINESFSEYLEKLSESQYLFQEMSNDLSKYCSEVQFDPQRLEEVNQRLFSLQQVMKKYGPTIKDVIKYRDEISKRLSESDELIFEIEKINKRISEVTEKYTASASKLSKMRREIGKKLEKEIEQVLAHLGIKGNRFRVKIENIPDPNGWVNINGEKFHAGRMGIDKVTFEISTNPGEPLRPLVDIVSGGEVSRIMLGLKSIMAGRDQIPVLIFDEIDSGISGRIASVVGEELRELSKVHQIICITHLPQIAGLGTEHIKVEKISKDGRSFTQVKKLSREERIEEIAKLIGGKEITDSAIHQAKELLK
jgi:DNA repair protein RecN (Recombination protein N)